MSWTKSSDLKFEVSGEDAAIIRAKLEGNAEIVMPDAVLDVIEDDPDDNRSAGMRCQRECELCSYGDRHLLKLGTYEAISIVTVRQFLDAAETEEKQ